METVGSIGLVLGPSLGGIIYALLGYSEVFWIYSACSMTIAVISFKLLPEGAEVNEDNSSRKMSAWELLGNKVRPP
jgi:predicted MFS family arabinose efflux permease